MPEISFFMEVTYANTERGIEREKSSKIKFTIFPIVCSYIKKSLAGRRKEKQEE